MYAPPAFPAESGFRSLGGDGGRSPSPMPSRRSLRPPPPPSRSRPRRQSPSTSPRRDRASLLRSRPRLDSSPPRGGLPLAPPTSLPPFPSPPSEPPSGLSSRRREGFRRRRSLSDDEEELDERERERAISRRNETPPLDSPEIVGRRESPHLGDTLPAQRAIEAGCRSTCRRALIFWLFDFLALPRRPFRIFNPQRSKENTVGCLRSPPLTRTIASSNAGASHVSTSQPGHRTQS